MYFQYCKRHRHTHFLVTFQLLLLDVVNLGSVHHRPG